MQDSTPRIPRGAGAPLLHHISAVLGRLGERDPDSSVVETGEKRRPMVGIALENYRRRNK